MEDGWTLLELYTSEGVHRHGIPLHDAVAKAVRDTGVGARCLIFKAIGGVYADGTITSHHVLDLGSDLPIKVEIMVRAGATEQVLERLRPLVGDEVLVRAPREKV